MAAAAAVATAVPAPVSAHSRPPLSQPFLPAPSGVRWMDSAEWRPVIERVESLKRALSHARQKRVDYTSSAVIHCGFFRLGDLVEFRYANAILKGEVVGFKNVKVKVALTEDAVALNGQIVRHAGQVRVWRAGHGSIWNLTPHSCTARINDVQPAAANGGGGGGGGGGELEEETGVGEGEEDEDAE